MFMKTRNLSYNMKTKPPLKMLQILIKSRFIKTCSNDTS